MPFIPVLKYEADWHSPTNQFRIIIWVQGAPREFPLPINTESEFTAVLTMLGRDGVLYDSENANLQVPPRPVET